ncbi:MAG: nucleotidyl transferase AbiEii/AbiGii toxin family protein [Patescibacteria group bacterium]
MVEKVLSKNAREALDRLGKSGILKSYYLAGGTALALQLGHRYSFDFDFFTKEEFDEKIIIQRLKELFPDFKLEREDWRTVLAYIGDIRFSLFFYKYPLLTKTHKFLNVEITDIKDIAPMKIAAIADRGVKRDFIDLYFIFEVRKILTLDVALTLYDKKFKALTQNKFHILKSLAYFEDAEEGVLPQMIEKVNWIKVKQFFIKEQKRLTKKLLGI